MVVTGVDSLFSIDILTPPCWHINNVPPSFFTSFLPCRCFMLSEKLGCESIQNPQFTECSRQSFISPAHIHSPPSALLACLSYPPFHLPPAVPPSSPHRRWMLQTDVEVFGLVRFHAAQGHPRLPDELIVCQLVFVAHGHPGTDRQGRGKKRKCRRKRLGERGKHE